MSYIFIERDVRMNKMYEYLKEHAYISYNKKSTYEFELSEERAECIANKYDSLTDELQQENKQLKEELKFTIGIVEHNRIISKKNKEIHQLKDNWNKLKEYIRKNIIYDDVGMKILDTSPLEDYMQELEQGSESDE